MQAKGAGTETIHDTPAVKRSHATAQKVPEACRVVIVSMNHIFNSTMAGVLFFTYKDCLLPFHRTRHFMISVTLSFEERLEECCLTTLEM